MYRSLPEFRRTPEPSRNSWFDIGEYAFLGHDMRRATHRAALRCI